jgi:glucosamine--fructose-6-phosphate aminotransferase (isomerizing)
VTSIFQQEIAEQPEVIAHLVNEGAPGVAVAAQAIRRKQPTVIVLVGRGSSYHAGIYARYLFERCNGIVVSQAAPSVYTRFRQPPDLSHAVIIGISQSGRSTDVSEVLLHARQHRAVTIAVTNDPTSGLASAAEYTLALGAGAERSVPASKTYTASLVTLAMLSAALDPAPDLSHALERLPDQLAELLECEAPLTQLGETFMANRALITGRGYQLATALEIALKLSEVAGISAIGMSVAELLHGWIAAVSGEIPALLLQGGEAIDHDLEDLKSSLGALGCRATVLAAGPTAGPGAISLPACAHPALAPVLATVAGQLIALGASRARGLDPDHPRGLSKVTLTT